jgi:hypothetical protein
MFGFFSSLSRKAQAVPSDGHRTDLGSRRMSLDERMQVRREMVFESVREHLVLLEIISSMYKFRAVALDSRQHRFMLAFDVVSGFVARRSGKVMRLNEVEEFLRERTFSRYGVRIDAIYWRFHADTARYERGHRTEDAAQAPDLATAARPQPALAVTPEGGTQGAIQGAAQAGQLKPASRHQPVSAEEMQAFERAIAEGAKPPPLHLGELEYQSDLAPLDVLKG